MFQDQLTLVINHLQRESDNGLTGQIYWSIDNLYFPEKGWNDFVLTVLEWWLDNFNNVFNNETFLSQFRFMDGPFWVCLYGNGPTVKLTFVDGRHSNHTVQEIFSDRHAVAKALILSVRQVMQSSHVLRYNSTQLSKIHKLSLSLSLKLNKTDR